MRLAIKTFGCRANSVDTDILLHEARERGFDIVEDTDSADAYIINSCTVTANADRDTRNQIRRFRRQNPQALVGVIGCYSQVAPQEVASQVGVDFVFGTADKDQLFHLLNQSPANPNQKAKVPPATGFLSTQFRGSRRARAAIKIQDGCNFRCSFCIVPTARGKSRSLPLETVLNQIQDAYAQGFNEVVLTGIHLAHYGWDKKTDLESLLERISEQTPGPRVRLSTLDPFEIPPRILKLLKTEPRLCPHFHIALQSGDDSTLSRMRRIYRSQEFIDITHQIKAVRPETFIGVDIIAGFPGEGESEFNQTMKCLEQSFWTKLHVFPYSVRSGTHAASMADRVPEKATFERAQQLREMSQIRHRDFLNSQVGTQREVLLERQSKKQPGTWLGHTENYILTYAKLPNGAPRALHRLKLTHLEGEQMWAN